MREVPKFRGLTAACAAGLAAALAACAQPPRTTCGVVGPAGGPPVISTRDQELCEAVRLRVAEALAGLASRLSPQEAEMWRDAAWRWEAVETLDGLVRRAREETSDEVAAGIGRAIADVREHSRRPLDPACADEERCLVRGAAVGARIAFGDGADVLRRLRAMRPVDPASGDVP